MALLSCPECSNQVSDAAASCPSCGHPVNRETHQKNDRNLENTELFKAGSSNFVLPEIAAVSCVKTRNWVYLVVGLPVIGGTVLAWMQLDWLLALGVTVAALIILGFIHINKGVIASTGNTTDIDEDMDKVNQRYQESMSQRKLITYQSRNTLINMSFSINPERIAEFSKAPSLGHIWLYVCGLAAGALAYLFFYNAPAIHVAAAALIVLGFLSRKSALQVTGVGGARMELYTRSGDIDKVIQELTQFIETRNKA
ncbi:MAG: zinc ribbon domain-containing protein [Pontibacterium sp.]